jgi:hypothetical protein
MTRPPPRLRTAEELEAKTVNLPEPSEAAL